MLLPNTNAKVVDRARVFVLLPAVLLLSVPMRIAASDHADPIDPLNRERLEGGITDLFVFPVSKDDKPVRPFERKAGIPLANTLADIVREPLTAAEMKQIDAVVFILCVRRQLTDTGSLVLEPYKYRIHIDMDSTVTHPGADDLKEEQPLKCIPGADSDRGNSGSGYGTTASAGDQKRPTLIEAFARYGGQISKPEEIREDLIMEFRLDNEAHRQPGFPAYSEAASAGWKQNGDIRVATGVFDDPFIFPAFFGTNVVAMAVRVPIELFPPDRQNFLVWATSHKGDRQVDHVGRSLRTQNPRFELLNTLHPSKHVDAITKEHNNPGLLRDIALRLNFAQTFAYRKWDFAPDVMCFSTRYPVGFPNGRLLTDDVAALLAQHGDTLLYELSYQHNNGHWPRQQANDKNCGEFDPTFPYLLKPHDPPPIGKAPKPLQLTTASIMKLIGIGLALVLLLILENWIVARIYHRIKIRKRNL